LNSNQLSEAITLYDGQVADAIGVIKKQLCIDLLFIAFIVIVIILSFAYANLAGLLTTLGLGGVTVMSQFREWTDTMKAYFSKAGQLRLTVKRLRAELVLCDSSDRVCLDNVKGLLQDYMEALQKAL